MFFTLNYRHGVCVEAAQRAGRDTARRTYVEPRAATTVTRGGAPGAVLSSPPVPRADYADRAHTADTRDTYHWERGGHGIWAIRQRRNAQGRFMNGNYRMAAIVASNRISRILFT
jgi:hypothetical protein